MKNLRRLAGESITLSEGEKWKTKRRNITTLLNFQYILSQFPNFVEIVQKSMSLFSEGREEFEINIIEMLENVTSSVMIHLFFGGGKTKAENFEIKGKRLGKYARELIEDIGAQSLHPLGIFLGQDYPKWGLRKFDREVNEKLKLYKQFVRNFVLFRIGEIK